MKRTLSIQNETGLLKAVILGIGEDQGGELDINPVSKWHKENGTYPTQEAIIQEIQTVEKALIHAGVEVLRPVNLPRIEQIFTRDIGFVIEDRFVIANMLEPVRQPEIRGIEWIIDQIDPSQIIKLPPDARVEGVDVIVYNEHVFVGISKRTNRAGFEYLQSQFPNKNFHPIELLVTDDHTTNILHLDCTFQPVGQDMAILYEDGFHNRPEVIYSLFSQEKLIKVTQQEMNQMFPNIFSISPNQVLIEKSFKRLSKELKSRGIEPIEVSYSETSKLSGLLRCSTLPLYRL